MAMGTTLLFCFYKFVEMKYLDKTSPARPLKHFVRDAIAVFSCVMAASLFYKNNGPVINDIMNTITDTKNAVVKATAEPAQVFTDDPGF